jgi:(S)-ureidoglycine aminohydrolase
MDRQPPGIFGHNRAVVTSLYAVMPAAGVMDSRFPGFRNTVVRVLTSPAIGAKFAQILLEIGEEGGMTAARHDDLEHFFYVAAGAASLRIGETAHDLAAGGYAYVPPGTAFRLQNPTDAVTKVIWIKRPYDSIDLPVPDALTGHRDDVPKVNKHTEGRYWQHLLPAGDMRFDMEVNILGFAPGTYFPCVETHVMEHGLYMLEGQGMYLLGSDWHECWATDFVYMAPFCPQFFYATGWEEAAYLLYKDVNRDVKF